MSALFSAVDEVLGSLETEPQAASPDYTTSSSTPSGSLSPPAGQTKPPPTPDPLDHITSHSFQQLLPTVCSPSDNEYHSPGSSANVRRHDSSPPKLTLFTTPDDISTHTIRNNPWGGTSLGPVQERSTTSIPFVRSDVHPQFPERLLPPTAGQRGQISLNTALYHHHGSLIRRPGGSGAIPAPRTSRETAPAECEPDSTTLDELFIRSAGHIPPSDDSDDLLFFI